MMCMLIKRSLVFFFLVVVYHPLETTKASETRFDGSWAVEMDSSATKFQRNQGFKQPKCGMSAEKMRKSPSHQQHWWELKDEEVPNQRTHHGRTSKRVSFSKPTAGHHSDAMIKIPRTFGAPKWIKWIYKSDPKPELPYWAFYMCKGSHKWSL